MTIASLSFALEKFTTFGDLLKFLRRRAGYTQRELSIAVGYSDTQISRLEHNERLPDLATLTARFLPVLYLDKEPEVATRLLELAAAVRREDAPAAGLPPYKGLRYFDEIDAELFFGRETLTGRLVDCIMERAASAERFLAVVGASGSGKSSVVRAGLIPTLRWQPRSSGWPIFVLTPSAHPLDALAATLNDSRTSPPSEQRLAQEMRLQPERLSRALQAVADAAGAAHTLLVVDQLEELFTLCRSEAEQAAFVESLTSAACRPGKTAVVLLVLRADFYAHCARFDLLRQLLARHQEYIGPMSVRELRLAIEEPAKRGHWDFEPGLVDLLLHDIGADVGQNPEPGALPLLSHALLATWQRRRGCTMTLSGYTASGGVRGAIAETAESVYYDQLDREQRQIARQIFLRLTELGGGDAAADTRRRVTIEELRSRPEDKESVHQVLSALADARLVITDQDSAEVAHEALIREWPTLRGWLEEDREGLRLHRHLTEAAQEWETLGRDPGGLYRGARLAQAVEWTALHADDVNTLEREFLEASGDLAEAEVREREEQRLRELDAARRLAEAEQLRAEEQFRASSRLRKSARRLIVALGVLVIILLAALALGLLANRNARAAQEQTRLATSRELAAAAVNNLSIDPERGALLALEALAAADTLEARNALHQALPELHLLHTINAHNANGAPGVALSPDGSLLVSAGVDDGIKIWDADSGELLQTLLGDPSEISFDVAFSPDGQQIATVWNSAIIVWNPATGERLFDLPGLTAGTVRRAAFSPDSSLLAVAAVDGPPAVWDLARREKTLVLAGHEQPCEAIAFSPDGALLATGDFGGTIKIWDAESGQELLTFTHGGGIHGLAFSLDHSQLAVASDNALVGTWDTETGESILTIPADSGAYDVEYMPDGGRLVTTHQGGTTIVWDAVSGRRLLDLAGHVSTVISVAAHPDNRRVVTSGYDGTVRVWDIGPGYELRTWAAHDAPIYDIAYTPDGSRLATVGFDGTAGLWDPLTGLTERSLLPEPVPNGLSSLAISPDGGRLALGGWDRALYIVEMDSGKLKMLLPPPEGPTVYLAFSPDSERLVTAGWGGVEAVGTARVWDVETGELELTLLPGTGGTGFDSVTFSPDGNYVLAGSDDDLVYMWEVESGREVKTFSGEGQDIYGMAVSPDGKRLAMGRADGVITIWDIAAGEQLHRLSGHNGLVLRLAFSSDGSKLASAAFDSLAKVWDVETGRELMSLYGAAGNVFGVAFSPDGRFLATANGDGTVRTFTLEQDELIALAHERVRRTLTDEECRTYLHADGCPGER